MMMQADSAAPGATGGEGPGRTCHVSQKELPGIAGDARFRTISEAVEHVEPGDTVVIHGGIYREHVIVDKSGTAEGPIRFAAAADEHVVVTGADEVTDWERADPENHIYRTPCPDDFFWRERRTHPGDDYHLLIGRGHLTVSPWPPMGSAGRTGM